MDTKDKLLRLQLARTGTFGMDGAEIAEQDLQDVLDTFDGHAPVSLGHYGPKQDWWPSYGNVVALRMIDGEDGGKILEGDVEVNPLLAEAIDEKFYTSWSVSIPARAEDGKRYLHHLAFLGAVPPKIRDLQIVQMTGAKPENAIDATGEGTDFADMAVYTIKDFKQETRRPGHPGNRGNDDFADSSPAAAKARKVYSKTQREKIHATLDTMLPAARRELLDEFADLAIGHDYDFADEERRGLMDILIDICRSMQRPRPSTGRTDFSDNPVSRENVDRASMAMNF
ncbi:MAG: hypothetical protein ACTTJZ_00805 [Sphaerochaetaceae bacterium]